jgi:hypothetical protein
VIGEWESVLCNDFDEEILLRRDAVVDDALGDISFDGIYGVLQRLRFRAHIGHGRGAGVR